MYCMAFRHETETLYGQSLLQPKNFDFYLLVVTNLKDTVYVLKFNIMNTLLCKEGRVSCKKDTNSVTKFQEGNNQLKF